MTNSILLLICLIVTSCIVYIYDYVAFPRNFLARIYSIFTGKEISLDRIKLPKLLECSLCASTWTTLIILLIFNWKLAPMCLVYGWSTVHILSIMNIFNNMITKILYKLYALTD